MRSARLKSMTGFGRASSTPFLVEIQGGNRRHLEISLAMPKNFYPFEQQIRKKIAEKVLRGGVHLSVALQGDNSLPPLKPNLAYVDALKKGWEEVAKHAGIAPTITLELLSREHLFIEQEVDVDSQKLLQAIENALNAFDATRIEEGERLALDFKKRIASLTRMIAEVEQLAPGAPAKYREKLKNRLEELFSGHVDNEEKVLKEVALFAEKIDITEEITRFKSHLKAVEECAQGKKFEFLLQELGREINTIGAKSSDIAVSKLVIDIKCELEKMREQVQNIE